jgi:methylenetetrahydrofolate dehydrogenase (NADP+)/methenyltetrahydrofolate cyclohydrolase
MVPVDKRLAADASVEEVEAEIEALNRDPAVSGILVQLPVPEHLDGRALTELVRPEKDVDGLTTFNAGMLALGTPQLVGATPLGVMVLLEEAGVQLQGAEAVVVGRSNLFGKPMAQLLLGANATVTVCHSRTRDLAAVCARADVLIAAIGRPRMLGAEHVKPGAVVIDVGMNRISPEEARNKSGLVGDVDHAAVEDLAAAITPVPGGVGPMTIAMLLRNTLQAARAQAERAPVGSPA